MQQQQQQPAPVAATTRPARWRGPRRPDVQELRHAQTARAHTQQHQQQQQQFYDQQQQQQQPRAMDDAEIFAAAYGVSQQQLQQQQSQQQSQQSQPQQQQQAQYRPRQLEPASGVRHFKFGFLSAGHADPAAQAVAAGTLRVNRRPGIMDATRMFEDEEASVAALSTEAKTARAVAAATRERHAAGLGYGTTHRDHCSYLSKALPPRQAESRFNERPCAFPTVSLPALESRPLASLESLSFEEQSAYSAAFKRRVASGLGYGGKRPNHYSYLANTYWRK